MSLSPAPPPVPLVPRPWNTLDRLRANLFVILLMDGLFLLALFFAGSQHLDILQTIGRDSAPSIISAQHIKVAIADMDAEAANELLAQPGAGVAAGEAYDKRRTEAAEELITAAKNITYGEAERVPIRDIQLGLGDYEMQIQRARDLHERNDPHAISAYRQASRIANEKLFVDADALDKANLTHLERSFDFDRNRANGTRIAVVAAGLILLAILVYLQIDLANRVRRILNPGLLAASLIVLAAMSWASGHLSRSAEDLRSARQDSFASLHALWRARAVAFSANADESKYLLDGDGKEDEEAFQKKAAQIFQPAEPTNPRAKAGGYLGDELANITFAGEREAAEETVRRWQAYLKIDDQIRALKTSGHTKEAIKLCLGTNEGESNWAFTRFDESLNETIDINQRAFDKSVASGFAELRNFTVWAAIGTALIALFAVLGIMMRMREFR